METRMVLDNVKAVWGTAFLCVSAELNVTYRRLKCADKTIVFNLFMQSM